ncbi:Uma2 family endonuclease [soil metagenome]
MATTTATRLEPGLVDHCVELRGIDWNGYLTMLRLRGEYSRPKLVYLDGTLYMMSPSFLHERLKERLGLFVMVVVEELDIPCIVAGETTFRRRSKRGGVEPDKSFYLTHEALVRGKNDLHLRTDPPPDLAVEAVNTHDPGPAVTVLKRFRVPEIWVGDEEGVRILVRRANGRYVASETSLAFPFLSALEIADWVLRPQAGSDTDWIKELRRWVNEVLAPRYRARSE